MDMGLQSPFGVALIRAQGVVERGGGHDAFMGFKVFSKKPDTLYFSPDQL
jgi:hypothetical protein